MLPQLLLLWVIGELLLSCLCLPRVGAALRDDIRWWSELWASGFNGVTFWPDVDWAEAERDTWWTDACMPSKFGAGDLPAGPYSVGGAGAMDATCAANGAGNAARVSAHKPKP